MDVRGLATCLDLIGKLSFHGVLTRSQIGSLTGLSPASVTNYTRWLLSLEVLTAKSIKQPHAIRPIDELRLNPTRGLGMLIDAGPKQIGVELVGLRAEPLFEQTFDVESPDQGSVFRALNKAIETARQQATKLSRAVDALIVSVPGVVSFTDGGMFAFDGIVPWHAVDINGVLASIPSRDERVRCVTRASCKAMGLAHSLKKDSGVGYLECGEGTVRLATVQGGLIQRGRTGLSTAWWLHRHVREDGKVCYCGREGCAAPYLEDAVADAQMLLPPLSEAKERFDIAHLGFEATRNSEAMTDIMNQVGFEQVHQTTSSDELARQGLRLRAADIAARTVVETAGRNALPRTGPWSQQRTRAKAEANR